MKKIFFITMGLLSVIITACGRPSSPSKSIDVTLTDFSFSPNIFIIPAGQQISFAATNNGAVTHSFIIMKSGIQVTGHFTEADKPNILWEVEQITPGQSVKEMFNSPPEAGEYQILCGVSGHFEAGMVAKLFVVEQP